MTAGEAPAKPLDRGLVAGCAVVALALVVAGAALYDLDDRLTHRLGDVVLADPTAELVARHGLRPIVRTVAAGDDSAAPMTFEEPVGPIVVHAGPAAAKLGLGPIAEGDWFSFVGGAHPRTAAELKRVLAAKLRRNASVREVSCALVRRAPAPTPETSASATAALDMRALGGAPWRPLGVALLVEAPFLLLAAWVAYRSQSRRPALALTLGAVAGIALLAQLVALVMLAEALV